MRKVYCLFVFLLLALTINIFNINGIQKGKITGPGLYIMNNDGTNLKKISPPSAYYKKQTLIDVLFWSKRNKFFYYHMGNFGEGDRDYRAYKYNIETGEESFVMDYTKDYTSNEQFKDFINPCSLDEKKMAGNDHPDKLYVKDMVTKKKKYYGKGYPVRWLPDNKRVLCFTGGSFYGDERKFNRWILDTETGKKEDITHYFKNMTILDEFSIRYSPDGKKIVYHITSNKNNEFITPYIYIINSDGTGLKKLAMGQNPGFSPDSKKIYYNFLDIYVINTDGSGKKRLTYSRLVCEIRSLSPDGKIIAFWARYGDLEIANDLKKKLKPNKIFIIRDFNKQDLMPGSF